MNYLIVGASSGIGKNITEKLLAQGNEVYTAQRTDEHIPVGAHHIIYNATENELNIAELPEQLDGLVYCPGSINLKPFNRLSKQDFVNDWEVNFYGAVKTIQSVLLKLKASKGNIVLFSSVAAQTGMSFHASISAAKAAIEGLTLSLAAELAPAVRVNAIAPSLTDTPLANKLLADDTRKEAAAKRHPLMKYGQADEIASMACFLLGRDASFITGQIFKIDGGISSIR